jgi:hypothetical protein
MRRPRRKITPDEMIRLMTSENATQAGVKAAAIMNEVGAVTRRLASVMLENESLSEISDSSAEVSQSFQGERSFDKAVEALEQGDGVGARIIRTYLGNGDEDRCPRDKQEIIDALASIKAAGIYAAAAANQ